MPPAARAGGWLGAGGRSRHLERNTGWLSRRITIQHLRSQRGTGGTCLYSLLTSEGSASLSLLTDLLPILNDEVTAFRWATRAEVADLAAEAYAVRVLDALRDESGPAVRQHDGTHVLDTPTRLAR